jgi:predicted amidohydrolase YtcJ
MRPNAQYRKNRRSRPRSGDQKSAARVDHVDSADATDSEGGEAVRIVISLKPNFIAKVEGDAVLDTLVGIQTKLSEAG